MKVYLWSHVEGVFLINEDFTKWAKPYFVTHPQRTLILKERYKTGMSKVDLLNTVTNEDLQQIVESAVIHWKPMLSYMVDLNGKLVGFAQKYIAKANLDQV